MVKIYCNYFGDQLNTFPIVGYSENFSFTANFNNRKAKIKSIAWYLRLYCPQWNINSYKEKSDVIEANIQVGFDLADLKQIGTDFLEISYPGTAQHKGATGFYIYEPGSYYYDSFFVTNKLLFNLNLSNHDVLNAWYFKTQILVETDEEIIY
jgi:hypothetical protein